MTTRDQVYRCNTCGNLVGIVHGADGSLVCCDEPMKLLEPNTVDAAHEKHVPVVEKNGKTVTVTVGSVPHPMDENHFIEVVGVLTDDRLYRAYLKPGVKPQAVFEIEGEIRCARAYCNLHGLWQTA